MRCFWALRPRPWWRPDQWPWRYYAWRLETYTGIPASEVTPRTLFHFLCQPESRRALWRYARWVRRMDTLRRW